MKKTVTALLTIAALVSTAAGVSVTPGETNVIGQTNESEIVSSQPFNASLQQENITVSPGMEFAPGTYTEDIEFSNSSRQIEVTLEEVETWDLNQQQVNSSINLGSSGSIQEIELTGTGNTGTTVQTSLKGNITQFLTVRDSLQVFPGISKNVRLSYQVPSDLENGLYKGTLQLEQKNVSLNIRLQDKINPDIKDISTPDYMSTQPEQFHVTAKDNVQVSEIIGSVERQVTVNGSKENRSVQDFRFEKQGPQSSTWTLTPDIEQPGKYFINFKVTDSSENQVFNSSSFTVEKLDAVNIRNDESINLDVYRSGEEIRTELGSITENTSVQMTLEDFSNDMSEEDWTVRVLSSEEGWSFFSEENSTINFDRAANLTLSIQSDQTRQFNGEISVKGNQYHESIQPVRFNGEYLDCPVPERNRFEVLNRNVTLAPNTSKKCSNSGWQISYFVSSQGIQSNSELASSVNLIVPQELLERQRTIQEEVIQEKEEQIKRFRGLAMILFLVLSIGSGYSYYRIKIWPTTYGVRLKSSENKLKIKTLRRKLNIEGRG